MPRGRGDTARKKKLLIFVGQLHLLAPSGFQVVHVVDVFVVPVPFIKVYEVREAPHHLP